MDLLYITIYIEQSEINTPFLHSITNTYLKVPAIHFPFSSPNGVHFENLRNFVHIRLIGYALVLLFASLQFQNILKPLDTSKNQCFNYTLALNAGGVKRKISCISHLVSILSQTLNCSSVAKWFGM